MNPMVNPAIQDKIRLARSHGYTDQQIKAYLTPQQTAPKKVSGRGGTLSSMISEAGGAGGAWGGAALGASLGSVVPGLGTAIGGLLGAGIGGFLGGTAGRGVENKVRDNQNFFGKGGSAKTAFGEGALSGALGAAGEGFQLLKAGKAATGVKGFKNVGTNLAAGAEAKMAGAKAAGALAKTGEAFRAQPRGIMAGIDQGGGRALSAAEAKAQNEAIDALTKGSKGLTKTGQFKLVDDEITRLKDAYKLTPEAKQLLGQDEIMSLMQGVEKNVTANTSLRGNLPKSAQTTLNNIYDDLTKMAGKSRAELVDYAAEVNKKAGAIVNKGQVGSKEVQVWEEVRNATKDFIDGTPGFADKAGVNKKLSTLLGAKSNLTKAVTSDVSSGMRQGITSGRLLSDAAGPAMDATGRVLQTADKVLTSTPGILAKGMGARGITNTVVNPSAPMEDQTIVDPSTSDMGAGQDIPQQMQQEPQAELYPAQNMMNDIQNDFQATGGKNVDKYLSLYKALSAVSKAQGTGQKYNSTASGVIADTTTGLQALQNLKGTIASSNVNNPIIGQLRGLNPYDTDAQNLQSQIGVVKQIVGKALEGGVLRKEDEVKYAKILPKLGDSDAVAQNKINQLYDLISQRLDLYKSSISGSDQTDLSSLISQYGGQ